MGLLSCFQYRRSLHQSDYVKAAHSLISTLNAVDEHPQLYLNKQVLRRAIHRYENIWIPLLTHVSRRDRTKLVPPLDVEWVWICHMLAPHIYVVDSTAIWKAHAPSEEGYVVDHVVLDMGERQRGLSRAESLWGSHFPDEPFNILTEIDAAPLVVDIDQGATYPKSRISYNIIAAAERQMAFHYQVTTPHYRHDGFLKTAAERYKKFLELYRDPQGGRFVPTFDIDLMWHIHQLHPHLYAVETSVIKGELLAHDDTLNDRTEGGELSQRWEATQKRWKEKYGSPICRAGGMFRGIVTAAERLLRSRLDAGVADLVGLLPYSAGRCYTMGIKPLQVGTAKPQADGDVDWVHMKDVGKSIKAGGDASMRISELAVADTEVRMEVRLTNVVAQDQVGTHSSMEFFDARNAQTDDALPLASVHVAPAGSIVLHQPSHSFRPYTKQGETLVLRIAGRDVALLAGLWSGYVEPVASGLGNSADKVAGRRDVRGNKDVPARPGFLRLAVTFLNERPQWTAIVSKYTDDGRTPPVLVIGNREKIRFLIDLAAGSVQFHDKADTVLASVVGMGAALLHVRLQPCYCPESNVRESSLYPKWMVQQQKYAALMAAGGEWNNGTGLVGYGQMLAGTAIARGYSDWTSVRTKIQMRTSGTNDDHRCVEFGSVLCQTLGVRGGGKSGGRGLGRARARRGGGGGGRARGGLGRARARRGGGGGGRARARGGGGGGGGGGGDGSAGGGGLGGCGDGGSGGGEGGGGGCGGGGCGGGGCGGGGCGGGGCGGGG